MKVLHVFTPTFLPPICGARAATLKSLDALGIRQVVLTPELEHTELWGWDWTDNIEIAELNHRTQSRGTSFHDRAVNHVRLYEADATVVHSHFGWTSRTHGIKIAQGLGLPLVASFYGSDILRDMGRPNMNRATVKVFDYAKMMTANTDFLKSKMVAYGADPNKIVVVPSTPADIRRTTKRQIGEDEALKVVIVGRLIPFKNVKDSIEALRICLDYHVPVHLTIIGDGILRKELERMVAQYFLEGWVDFKGKLDNAACLKEIQEHDVITSASLPQDDGSVEAFGVNIVEGSLLGLTPVVYDSGGVGEVVCPPAGVLLRGEQRRPDMLAESWTMLHNNRGMLRDMAIMASTRARAYFTSDTSARALRSIYGLTR